MQKISLIADSGTAAMVGISKNSLVDKTTESRGKVERTDLKPSALSLFRDNT